MIRLIDNAARRFGAGSRRRVLRGLLGCVAAALAGAAPRRLARAHEVASYCADAPELEFLALINDYRAQNGLGTLSLGQHISAAAQHHSADMADRNYFSHTTLGTSDGPDERMLAHGYPANTTWWGENIYAGYGIDEHGADLGSARAAFEWWKNSPGHNANMLSPNYTVIGIDRASNPTSQYRNYWTTDFGGASDQAATICGGPAPATVRLAIVGYEQSSNATSAALADDRDRGTVWRTRANGGAPKTAWARFDLGSARAISEIRWQFSRLGYADRFRIQISADGTAWQTLATRGNADAAGLWQALTTTAVGRYVRFSFVNPEEDYRLGYLSEVRIYGPAAAGAASRSAPAGTAGDGAARQAPLAPAFSQDPDAADSAGYGQQERRRPRRKKRRQGMKKRT
jgi:uncharacterized protein YkwD